MHTFIDAYMHTYIHTYMYTYTIQLIFASSCNMIVYLAIRYIVFSDGRSKPTYQSRDHPSFLPVKVHFHISNLDYTPKKNQYNKGNSAKPTLM